MRAFAPMVLITVALVGCDQAAPAATAPAPGSASMTRPASVAHPLTGHCETEFDLPAFPPPRVHRQTDTGTCRMTHLGLAEFYSVKDIDFASGTQITREATFTAVNGDILRATGTGTSRMAGPGRVSFTATLTLVGGSGRFAHATGEAQVLGEADLATRTAFFEIVSGWIAYDASDRGGS